jgi:hypothetical protein
LKPYVLTAGQLFLMIGGFDPVTKSDILEVFKSSQVANATQEVSMWISKRNNRPITDLEEQRRMFNQVRFAPVDIDPILEPVACWAVTSNMSVTWSGTLSL